MRLGDPTRLLRRYRWELVPLVGIGSRVAYNLLLRILIHGKIEWTQVSQPRKSYNEPRRLRAISERERAGPVSKVPFWAFGVTHADPRRGTLGLWECGNNEFTDVLIGNSSYHQPAFLLPSSWWRRCLTVASSLDVETPEHQAGADEQ